METGIEIRTQDWDIVRVLREGWRMYRTHFVAVLLVVVCVYAPVNIVVALLPASVRMAPFGVRSMQGFGAVSIALKLLVGAIATVGLAYLAENALAGRPIGWREALRYGLATWPSVLVTGLLAAGIVALFTLLLVFPGIVWAVYYAFSVYIVALRGLKGRQALDYSRALVKEQWERTCGMLLATGIAGAVVGLAFASVWGALPGQPALFVLIQTIADVAGALFTLVSIVFFLNMDYRKKAPYKPKPIIG